MMVVASGSLSFTFASKTSLCRGSDFRHYVKFKLLLLSELMSFKMSLVVVNTISAPWLRTENKLLNLGFLFLLDIYEHFTICSMFWSILGRCSTSASGRKGTDFDQEDQAAAGPRRWKEHAYRRNQRHEGHAGCQGEKSQCPAEKGT